jgi:hypothetical protein
MSKSMIWVLEIIVLLVFVGFGGFTGFIAWAVLTALIMFGRYTTHQTRLKAAEVMLRAERNALENGPRPDIGRRHAERETRPTRLPAKVGARSDAPRLPPAAILVASSALRPESQGRPVTAARRDTRACAKCGAPNDEDAVFCNACGASIDVPRICSCGTTNASEARFCKKCGGPFDVTAPALAPSVPVRSRPIAKVVRLRECEECGTKNRGDAYKCTNCGSLFP